MIVIGFCTLVDCKLLVRAPLRAPIYIFMPLIEDDAGNESKDDDDLLHFSS